MKSLIIISPKVGFESASGLADLLGVPYENPYDTENRNFSKYDFVFKYGFSRPIKVKGKGSTLNKTSSVEISKDKIKTFDLLKDACLTVDYTQDKLQAQSWLKKGVVARNIIDGADGDGVEFCFTQKEFNNIPAKFYTKYIEHTNEYRVNIWRNKVVSVYDKINVNGIWQFKLFKGVEDHPQLLHIAEAVYKNIGLDWCGLDVLRDSKGNLHLLEVNSAPVLYPYTMKKLANIIKSEILQCKHEK